MLTARRPPSDLHDDPLTIAMRPPDTETEAERRFRLQKEAEAKRISEAIDEELRVEKKIWDKKKQDIRLLLLGQAESGKSTLQKQFQLIYNPESLEQERISWRSIVYFNIARSVKHILEVLELYGDSAEDDALESSDNSSNEQVARRHVSTKRPAPTGPVAGSSAGPSRIPANGSPVSSKSSPSSAKMALVLENQRLIATLRMRLSPLVTAEAMLADKLSGGLRSANPNQSKVLVRRGWQMRAASDAYFGHRASKSADGVDAIDKGALGDGDIVEIVHEVASVLGACKRDVQQLWENEAVQKLIHRRRLRLEESAEYFLHDVMRISSPDYVPDIDDILHARIQTMGVAEHQFDVPLHGRMVTWHLYDVGGARGQRHTWVPYFDDANAIIFVAPISAFDQYLEEDPRTNRIDDSLQLFTAICSNQLLKNVHLVLFLNKVDILQNKLTAGIQVKKYITSFGDRANDYETVVNYFRAHFNQVHRKTNEKKRVLYSHLTSVVDTKTTRSIIANVRDSIFRDYLKSAALV
ncbi:guanine nucleotide-binding protein [Vararia minispora EC-137]|uniref:Guanine nucleotide-binding protein n=1 Tax=Vararia minispora EC-137 TaxID=1314806 RepID=A0ACB8QI00_9AGAM|nr:guanine nucleotide-binding protein [Vararia minispora EC-137]